MKKLSKQNVRHSSTRQRYQLKRQKWGPRERSIENTQDGVQTSELHLVFIDAVAPPNFDLQPENVDNVIDYINRIKRIGKGGKGINLILTDVTKIGIGAISMLLSVIEELFSENISFKGQKPSDLNARNVLERSGFMKFVDGKTKPENQNTKNEIFTGNKRTHHTEILDVVHNSMETVWGVKGRSPLLYGTIVEMIKNSCKHAFKSDHNVRWHFAVSHDEENRVKFSFVDNGIGIVKSHEHMDIIRTIGGVFRNNADFIEGAYTEGIKSKTGLTWRGTGLPTIYETFDEKVIKNFVVITNDVYCNFESNTNKILNNEFKGTYYYWEIDSNCEKHCFV